MSKFDRSVTLVEGLRVMGDQANSLHPEKMGVPPGTARKTSTCGVILAWLRC